MTKDRALKRLALADKKHCQGMASLNPASLFLKLFCKTVSNHPRERMETPMQPH
jgi:hypothetical protein